MFTVICEDGHVRHPEPFETLSEAKDFAWWGHCCTDHHDFTDSATGDTVRRTYEEN